MTDEQALEFFENFSAGNVRDFKRLAQSGSARINWLATSGDENFIVTFNENLRENEAFFYFSELFSELNLNTPEVLNISDDRKIYVQEFLGAKTLSEIITEEGVSQRVKNLVRQTLTKLHTLQTKTLGKTDFAKTFEYESYDALPVMHDLYYFKNFIADVLELHYHKSSLLKEFLKLTEIVENLQPKVLMLRDFQARNILVNDQDEVFFIDYQSAMEGPAIYDAVSFLFQAKANFPESFKSEMLEFYFSLWENEAQRNQLKFSLKPVMLMRFLQVLGAYGFRGLVQRKPHFLQSLNLGIKNITEFSQNWEEMQHFPELKSVIAQLDCEKNLDIRAKI